MVSSDPVSTRRGQKGTVHDLRRHSAARIIYNCHVNRPMFAQARGMFCSGSGLESIGGWLRCE